MNESYTLVWEDQFDYNGIPDPKKWRFEIGGDGFGNQESQYYTNNLSNAYVKDGKLTIEAKKEKYAGNDYTSAKLTTHGIKSFKYGRFVIKAKLPYGEGTWPAIWMLPNSFKDGKNWPLCGEIDILEHVGKEQNFVHFSLHSSKYNHKVGTQLTESHHIQNVSETFNEYTLEWTPEYIKYYINGTSFTTFYKSETNRDVSEEGWPFDQPFYIILNLAIGGFWGGKIDDSIFPQRLEIEYVKVYQKVKKG